MSKIPLHPKNPERICWGCDRYCPADNLGCSNGSIRTSHPAELYGDDWLELEQRHSVPERTPTAVETERKVEKT